MSQEKIAYSEDLKTWFVISYIYVYIQLMNKLKKAKGEEGKH